MTAIATQPNPTKAVAIPAATSRQIPAPMAELAPSDSIILAGLPWAATTDPGPAGPVQVKMPVRYPHLILRPAFAAAVLANCQVGAMRLEIFEERGWFGRRHLVVRAARGTERPTWVNGTIEADLALRVKDGWTRLSDAIYAALGPQTCDPWQTETGKRLEAATRRGLLRKVETKEKIFWRWTAIRQHFVPASAAILDAARHRSNQIEEQHAFQATPVEVNRLIADEVDRAFAKNTASEG